MLRFIGATVVVAVTGALIAAPLPPEQPANARAAGLSDPDAKVRDGASVALRDRADALRGCAVRPDPRTRTPRAVPRDYWPHTR